MEDNLPKLTNTQFLAIMRGPVIAKMAEGGFEVVALQIAIGQRLDGSFIFSGPGSVEQEERHVSLVLRGWDPEGVDLASQPVQLQFFDYNHPKEGVGPWTNIQDVPGITLS